VSWDIFIQKFPESARTIAEIPDDYCPPAIGARSRLIEQIRRVFPGADFSDPAWGIFDGPDFSIEFNVGENEIVEGIALHVRGSDSAAAAVADLLDELSLRAIDSSSGEFFARSAALESLRKWREFRDRAARQF
jgi:hypothetical protein